MGERKSISQRVKRILLGLSLTAVIITAAVAVSSMMLIRNQVVQDSKQLGDSATNIAAESLTAQMEQNRLNVADSRAEYASAQLNRIAGYVESLKSDIEFMYAHPERYGDVPVLPPDKKNAGKYVMMRDLKDESIGLEDINEDMCLLGNMDSAFSSIMEVAGDEIATMYMGVESGIMISYDQYSQLADPGPGNESYFDFTQRPWYISAKETGGVVFSDTYMDDYGRGLTISCSAPFTNAEGEFAGVVSMDILIDDLLQSIINLQSTDGSYVMLVEKDGDIIASPFMEKNQETFENILKNKDSEMGQVADKILSGVSGIAKTEKGVYYSYAEIGMTDWTLVIYIPAESIGDPVDKIEDTIQSGTDATLLSISRTIRGTILTLLIVIFIIIAGVLIVSGKFSDRIIRPLIALRDDVMIISGGDLKHKAKIVDNDEVGDLATAFNDMSSSLTEYIDNLTKVTAEKERIGAELNVATQIQADMLPRKFPPFPDRTDEFDLYASMDPAKEVGGDFYDFFLIDDDHIGLVMADVSGKGVPAALFMVIAKTLIKNRALLGGSPSEVLEYANDQLCEGNEAELFVTVWMAIIEISTGKGVAANAGHEHPVIKRRDGKFELSVYRHSPAVATMEGIPFKQHDFELYPGDSLFVYTDGVPEATNADNELYGTDRLLEALNSEPDADVKRRLEIVKASVDSFVGEAPQFDDLTMLAFDYHGKKQG
ncbi:MAG: SpoIIE family protein phosphatase [Lachnospiraceae bacterium]|nr:SpoIIE family protein phosphatase [Lachnospiraceae bacterium]